MTNLLTKIKNETESLELHKGAGSVLIALSGGPDSVFLFYFYLFLREQYASEGKPLRIYAAHLNHMLRGEEADRDEAFCRELCRQHSVELFTSAADIRKMASLEKMSVEEAAREARYQFLTDTAEAHRISLIATGHNSDDQAETVLFNIIRGAGTDGASGISLKRGRIVRPLLFTKKSEIKDALDSEGLKYIYDSSNSDTDYTRNKIRHEIIPLLKSINPAAGEALSRFGMTASEDADYFDSLVNKIFDSLENKRSIELCTLLQYPRPVLKRLLRLMALSNFGIRLDYKKTNALCTLAEKGKGRLQLSGSFFAAARYGRFDFIEEISQKKFIQPLTQAENFLPDGRVLCCKTAGGRLIVYNSIINVNIPYDKIVNTVYARNRCEGDSFFLNGINRSLKKLMIDKKISSEKRDRLLVISDAEKIFWCEEIGLSDYLK